ncbi:MAG TPA: ATP-binding protein [Labilithrix sp.]|nr:ATP-binding protein [Labilithrix sp.]
MDISTCVLDELDDAVGVVRTADCALLAYSARFVEWFGPVEARSLPEVVRARVEPLLGGPPIDAHKPYAKPVRIEIQPVQKRAFLAELVVRQSAEPGVVVVTIKSIAKLVEKDAMVKSFSSLVDQNNRLLKREKQAVSELLDNMRQAVFVFDAAGIVQEPVSAYARVVFGQDVVGQSIGETVFRSFGPKTEAMHIIQTALTYAFGADELQWLLNADKLPERFEYEAPGTALRRRLRAAYTPLWDDDGNLQRIMMVVEDVTQLEGLEMALAAERAASARRLTIIEEVIDQDPTAIVDFLRGFDRSLVQIEEAFDTAFANDSEPAFVSISRALHTMKGNSRTLGLRLLADAVHRCEDALATSKAGHDQCAFRSGVVATKSCFDAYRETSARILPSASAGGHFDAIAVERTLFQELEAALRTRLAPNDSLLVLLERLTNVKLVRLKGELDAMAQDLGAQLGKSVRVELVGGGIAVPRETYDRVHDCLVHLIRNAIDHGVEEASARAAAGKPPTATIRVTCSAVAESLNIVVEDDGRGIDTSAVLERAVARGLITPEQARSADQERAFELLLLPGFSTKTTVSDVSGRGVGLDVVSATVRQQGGALHVDSGLARGTSWSLVFPRERDCPHAAE